MPFRKSLTYWLPDTLASNLEVFQFKNFDVRIYSGPVSNGKPLFAGFEPGSEAVMTGLSAAGRVAAG